jgi:hypothetical protein
MGQRNVRMLGALTTTLLAGSVARADIMPIGEASVAGFVQGVGTGETPRGWDFLVNAANVSVTRLGVAAATAGPITLTLWDDTTRTELAQVTEETIARTWTFVALGSPVSLVQGQTYSVIGWEDTAATPWYLFNNRPPAAFDPTGAIEYLGVRYANGIDADEFPESTLSIPAQYGVTDIAYTTSDTRDRSDPVAEPGAVLLLATAIAAGLAASRRSRGNYAAFHFGNDGHAR